MRFLWLALIVIIITIVAIIAVGKEQRFAPDGNKGDRLPFSTQGIPA